jgi:hypothetical protein
MNKWCLCWLFTHIFTEQCLYKLFGAKGLNINSSTNIVLVPMNSVSNKKYIETLSIKSCRSVCISFAACHSTVTWKAVECIFMKSYTVELQ